MKGILKIIKFILITIITICITAIILISTISSTILKEQYITKKLEETNFYSETYELVKSNFENYIYQSGLEEEVLNGICTQEKVIKDVNIIISNIYEGSNETISTEEISQKLNENIANLNIKNTDSVKQFVSHICDEYVNTIIHTQYESKINDVYKEVTQLLNKSLTGFIISTIFFVVLLILTNINQMSKMVQDAGITLLATSSLGLISCKILTDKVYISGIKIFNETFSKVIVTIIQDIISNIVKIENTLLITSVIVIIVYVIISITKDSKKETVEKL